MSYTCAIPGCPGTHASKWQACEAVTSNECVSDEILAERIETASELLQHGYQSRTMRETLLIAKELQRRRAAETRAEPSKLEFALRGLYWDQVDYLTLNKLGGMNNHWMRAAREALGMDPNDTRPAEDLDPLSGVRWICRSCTTVNGNDDAVCLGCGNTRENPSVCICRYAHKSDPMCPYLPEKSGGEPT